jgi:hypothetical protein
VLFYSLVVIPRCAEYYGGGIAVRGGKQVAASRASKHRQNAFGRGGDWTCDDIAAELRD